MIHFIATFWNRMPFRDYTRNWARFFETEVNHLLYSDLRGMRSHAPGLYIFSDLDHLNAAELRMASELYLELSGRKGFRCLNDPSRYVDRFTMLRQLHEEGLNDFRMCRFDEAKLDRLHYPVFLRMSHLHNGPQSDLLDSPDALRNAYHRVRAKLPRALRPFLVVVEYCDTSDADGIFRKYSVLRVADHYFPRHLFGSTHWLQKNPENKNEAFLEEEARFMEDPHDLDLVRNMFERSGVEYGRIDYGYRDGRMQVWEININPRVVASPDDIHEGRQHHQVKSAKDIALAIQNLVPDSGGAEPAIIPATMRRDWPTENPVTRWHRLVEKWTRPFRKEED